jgi:hypothetical protein
MSDRHHDSGPGLIARFFNPYRLACYALVLYAVGHTLGAVLITPSFGAASDRVVEQMQKVVVVADGARDSWYGFYRGLGFMVTIFLVYSAIVAWVVGGLDVRQRRALWALPWFLLASHIAVLVVAVMFLFPTPIAFAAVVVVLLALGCGSDLVRRPSEAGRRTATDALSRAGSVVAEAAAEEEEAEAAVEAAARQAPQGRRTAGIWSDGR